MNTHFFTRILCILIYVFDRRIQNSLKKELNVNYPNLHTAKELQ